MFNKRDQPAEFQVMKIMKKICVLGGSVSDCYRKIYGGLLIACFVLIHVYVAEAEELNLPRDADGWTIFTPSADSRLVYVSADGDDSAGRYYLPSEPEIGSDPFEPAENINAYATYAAAYAQTRDGYPDWVLLRRGDTFYEAPGSQIRNGRSSYEPFVVASYGSSGLSPLFKTGARNGVKMEGNNYNWIAVSGLSFYAHTRDPDSSEYQSCDAAKGLEVLITGLGQGILIEGCKFRFYDDNRIGRYQGGNVRDFVFRRNLVLDNYDCLTHSQGLLVNAEKITIEENIFDHNGWLIPQQEGGSEQSGGQATKFNHNIYMAESTDYIIKDNILMRPSSLGTKLCQEDGLSSNVLVDNNLYVDGEIGLGFATHTEDEIRYSHYTITNNVMTNIGRSMPTGRSLGWYMTIGVVDGAVVKNNYLLHQTEDRGGIYGVILERKVASDVLIEDNVIYGLRYGGGVYRGNTEFVVSNILLRNNSIQIPLNSSALINLNRQSENEIKLVDNTYFSDVESGRRYRINGIYVTLDELSPNDNSIYKQIEYSDPNRDVDTYMASVGETATIDAFIEKCRAQDRYSWDSRFTAEEVNVWIKEGFRFVSPPGNVRIAD